MLKWVSDTLSVVGGPCFLSLLEGWFEYGFVSCFTDSENVKMTWWRKEPGYQRIWNWPSCCGIFLGGHFKNTYELINLRALKFSPVDKINIFQCMGKISCVEFQRYPLKFHTKYLSHTLNVTIFIQSWNFKKMTPAFFRVVIRSMCAVHLLCTFCASQNHLNIKSSCEFLTIWPIVVWKKCGNEEICTWNEFKIWAKGRTYHHAHKLYSGQKVPRMLVTFW